MATSSGQDKIDFDDGAGPSKGTRKQKTSSRAAASLANNKIRQSSKNKGMTKSKRNPGKNKKNKQAELKTLPKFKKECINPVCPRQCDKFQEAPRFVLTFFHTMPRNKSQLVCDECFEQAVATFEKMGDALINNTPLADVQVQEKQDLIEIEDSDEEELAALLVPSKDKILFNKKVEDEMESILDAFANKIDFCKQAQGIRDGFKARIDQIERDSMKTLDELTQLGRSSTRIYNALYAVNKRPIMRHPSIDADGPIISSWSSGPGAEEMEMRKLEAKKAQSKPEFIDIAFDPPGASSTSSEQFNYAIRVRSDGKRHWSACRLLKTITDGVGKKSYRIEFVEEDGDRDKRAEVSGKELAFSFVNQHLRAGARVIARFFTAAGHGQVKGRFLPGVVGEKLCEYNTNRYLIFCDYGQVRYAPAEDVREMIEKSPNVWEDCHPNLRHFIREYIENKTLLQRRLLNLRVNQQVTTEHKRKWHVNAVVQEVDASLVKINFPEDNSEQWLYRGSKRLAPLYTQAQRSSLVRRRKHPCISIITIGDVEGEAKQNTAKITEKLSNL